jgi:threonine dehydrogenase-like Zn-dependent dehydrogenase
MRALCWHGKGDVRVDTVPDPKIQHPRDAVIKITACAICGSDLHLLDGYQPTMESGDILGHENMGEVVELGAEVKNLRIGDRVVVRSRLVAANAGFARKASSPAAIEPTPMPKWPRKPWDSRPPGFSVLATCSVDKREGRQSICGSRWRMWVQSKFRTT